MSRLAKLYLKKCNKIVARLSRNSHDFVAYQIYEALSAEIAGDFRLALDEVKTLDAVLQQAFDAYWGIK